VKSLPRSRRLRPAGGLPYTLLRNLLRLLALRPVCGAPRFDRNLTATGCLSLSLCVPLEDQIPHKSMHPRPLLSGTDFLEVPALELPTTPRAVRDLLGVGFARFQIIEIHPLMFASDPPELSPDFVLSPTWTTQRDHRLIPF
jgi:hypothetical protein